MGFEILKTGFEALKLSFEVEFGRKLARDGDPRLGRGCCQTHGMGHGETHGMGHVG